MDQKQKSPSQEYLDNVSPMGNALTEEESAHLRDLLIAEGKISFSMPNPDDYLEPGDEEKLPPEIKEALARVREDNQFAAKKGGTIKP